jgi:hypothetical protein
MKLSLGKWILKGFGFALMLSAISASALAAETVPEMDPGLATSAMALLGGGMLMIAGRSPRK